MLKEKMEKVKQEKVNGRVIIEVGSPVEGIIKAAEEDVDIIIMGSRRMKRIGKVKFLGSVTRRVSEIAECPVMLIH